MKSIIAVLAAFLIGVVPLAHAVSHGGDGQDVCQICQSGRSLLITDPAPTTHLSWIFAGRVVLVFNPPERPTLFDYSQPRGPPLNCF